MRIGSSSVSLASTHQFTKIRERKETLQVSKDEIPSTSLRGQGVHSAKPHGRKHWATHDNSRPFDFKYHVLADMIRRITEKGSAVSDGSKAGGQAPDASTASNNSPQPAEHPTGWAVRYTAAETYAEQEQTSFQAKGVVTADGKEINFSVSLTMGRSYAQALSAGVSGGTSTGEPLVPNLGEGTTALSDNRIQFHINTDGIKEDMPFPAQQSGFLVIDKNGNGVIDDASEVLGATTGDGFRELAAYDTDKNGWIDENDAVYSQLRVWKQNGDVQALDTLQASNVGAIYTAGTTTPFDIKNDQNQTQAKIRQTGLYLAENGTPGIIQSIDIAV